VTTRLNLIGEADDLQINNAIEHGILYFIFYNRKKYPNPNPYICFEETRQEA
jgi:hypothetical protein